MLAAIQIETPPYMSFAPIYRTENVQATNRDWKHLSKQLKEPFIVGGDFNAHHPTWGYKINNHGNSLANVIDDLSLIVLNDGSPTLLPSPVT